MTYEEFRNQFLALVKEGCGNITWEESLRISSKMADLVEEYPLFDEELEQDYDFWDQQRKKP